MEATEKAKWWESTPLRAIRKKCLSCAAPAQMEVRKCATFFCPLWGYRMGRDANAKDVQDGTVDTKEAIGYRIRKYREEEHMSPQELATAVERTRWAIYNYESGRTPVTRPMIRKIAKALGVEVSDLVD